MKKDGITREEYDDLVYLAARFLWRELSKKEIIDFRVVWLETKCNIETWRDIIVHPDEDKMPLNDDKKLDSTSIEFDTLNKFMNLLIDCNLITKILEKVQSNLAEIQALKE